MHLGRHFHEVFGRADAEGGERVGGFGLEDGGHLQEWVLGAAFVDYLVEGLDTASVEQVDHEIQ